MKKGFLIAMLWTTCGLFCLSPLQAFSQERIENTEGSKPGFRTWIQTNSYHQPTAIGFSASAASIEQTPDEMYEVALPLPKRADLPFTHVYVGWNPHGHEPPEIYGLPHFDVHFYILSNQEREGITCSNADQAICMKQPAASALPANYGPTPAGVPKMGWHWVDLLSPEFHGQTFTTTMILGYYDGGLAFFEPMITKAFLESRPNFTAAIRQPATYPRSGYYPSAYRVSYRSVTNEYEVVLNHLIYRH